MAKDSFRSQGRGSAGAKTKLLPKVGAADGKTIRTPLTQNPHAIRDTREKVLEVAIGREVRAFRKKLGITVADLAVATDISLGMLSKIENGITSPSLTTLAGAVAGARRSGHRLLPPLRGRTQRRLRQGRRRRSMSSAAARAPATSTICSAISARTPAASSSSLI